MRGLEDYRLLRLLGDGGEGRAFLAMDLRLMRRVVIKTYHHGDTREARRRFAAEARRMALLEGPRVVQVYDAVSSGGQSALVLRYVPGCNLEELLQREERLSPANTLSVLTDLAAGLAAARQQLLVHGDMKPSNVLMGPDGHAALTDFGISVVSGRPPRGASAAALTPEHCRGEALTRQSDFFALGLLTYRMLTGRHLFAAGERVAEARLAAGLSAPPPLPAALPPRSAELFGELLCWLMAPLPEQRPSGTIELRNHLRTVRAELPAPRGLTAAVARQARDEQADATVPPLPARLRRLPRSERWVAAARAFWRRLTPGARFTAACSVLLLTGIGGAYTQRPGECVEILPSYSDLSPLAMQILPSGAALESRMAQFLHRTAAPVLVTGEAPGTDSRGIVRPQGVRDICVAQRRLKLFLRCWGDQCRMALQSTAPGLRRRTELEFPSDIDLPQMYQTLDQLMAGHVPTLMAPLTTAR